MSCLGICIYCALYTINRILWFQVFFLPLSNTLVTCFKDNSIFAWDSEGLQCKYQLPVPPENEKQAQYKAMATPKDGRTLVAGGR